MKYRDLVEFNDWWDKGQVPGRLLKAFRRDSYFRVSACMDRKQIVSIVGLRRVGKTTIIYQAIEALLSRKVKPGNILYFSFDEHAGKEPSEVLDVYANEILNKSLDSLDEKVYVFFDEIQKAENWENQLKKYYDLNYNIKFVLSGSASLKIRKKTKETLAGRFIEEKMGTLSFKEFLGMKKLEIRDVKLQEAQIKPFFYEYLTKGGFPEFVDEKDEDFIRGQIENILVDRIIYQDIPEIFKIKEPKKLLAMLKIISSTPGMLVDYGQLGSDLGLTRQTASNMVEYLSDTFLVKVLYNFSKNLLTSEKKLKKCYPADNSLARIYNGGENQGRLVESMVVGQIGAKFFWRKQHFEVDVVLEKDGSIIPIEVKYKDAIDKKDLKGLLKFMELYKLKEGIILTKEIRDERIMEDKTVKLIPVWSFLLDGNFTESSESF